MEFLIKCFLAICLIFGGKNSVFGDFDDTFSRYQPVVHFGRDPSTFRSGIEEIKTSMSKIEKGPSTSYNICTEASSHKNLLVSFFQYFGIACLFAIIIKTCLCCCRMCFCKKPSIQISTNYTLSNDLLV